NKGHRNGKLRAIYKECFQHDSLILYLAHKMVNYKDGVCMKIGVIQLQSVLDPRVNLEKIRGFMKEASEKSVKAIFLPEVFYSISNGLKPTPYLVEGKNEHYEA